MTAYSAPRQGDANRAMTRGAIDRLRAAATLQGGLAAAIEGEIVPRLLRRRVPSPTAAAPASGLSAGQEVVDLAAFALAHDAEGTRRYVQAAAADRSIESVCFDLLAPAARHLGELWVEDLCTFTDVTIGMLHLQHALHGVVPPHLGTVEGFRRRRILLAPAPGEQHTFGLAMVQTFFMRAGWQVTALAGCTAAELQSAVATHWFGVLGLSVGSEARLGALETMLGTLRMASRNGGLAVIVGGPIFAAAPALAASIGADGTASDATEATWLAENLLGARAAML